MFPWFSDRHVREYAKAASRYYGILRQREELQMNNNEHIERTKRMIEVMQAYVDGEEIEYSNGFDWSELKGTAWIHLWDYRIAKKPDTIDWSHVAPEFKWMVRDPDGEVYLYKKHPVLYLDCWSSDSITSDAESHASYHRGTCDWKESLVIRPGCEQDKRTRTAALKVVEEAGKPVTSA